MDPKRASRTGPGPIPLQKPASSAKGTSAPAQPAARRPVPGLQETLDHLAKDIRQLQIDFERFFNGGLHVPPEELRTRIQTQLRNLRNMNISAAVDNFRLGDLEARFNTYNELFNRRLREREEGKHQPARTVVAEKRRYDPMAGIVVGASPDPDAVEALYHGLASGPEAPKFDLDSFQTYLNRQVAALREKTGCSQVQFRLAAEDGKLKLKARPIAAREGSQGDHGA